MCHTYVFDYVHVYICTYVNMCVKYAIIIPQNLLVSCHSVGRDSSVGIATRYGLDGPGIDADPSSRAV